MNPLEKIVCLNPLCGKTGFKEEYLRLDPYVGDQDLVSRLCDHCPTRFYEDTDSGYENAQHLELGQTYYIVFNVDNNNRSKCRSIILHLEDHGEVECLEPSVENAKLIIKKYTTLKNFV